MKILLSGATGFLGSHLAKMLIAEGYSVFILKRSHSNEFRIQNLTIKSFNIDSNSLKDIFTSVQPDVVIHTACNYGRNNESFSEILKTNLLFSVELLEQSIAHNVRAFLNTGTTLDSDINPYALSKNQFVEWLKKLSDKIACINLRIEYMYGPQEDLSKLIPSILDKFDHGKDIHLTSGEQMRDFIYIEDVVSAYLKILKSLSIKPGFQEHDICTGNLHSLKDFITKLKQKYEIKFGFTESKLLFGSLPQRANERLLQTNNSSLKNLGWAPQFSIDQGLEQLISSYTK